MPLHTKIDAPSIFFVKIKVSNRYLGKRSIIFRILRTLDIRLYICWKLIILTKRVNFKIWVIIFDQIEIYYRLVLLGQLEILVWLLLFLFDFGRRIPSQTNADVFHYSRIFGQNLIFQTVCYTGNLVGFLNVFIVAALCPLNLRLKSLWLENQVVGRFLIKVTFRSWQLLNLYILIKGQQVDNLIMINTRRLLGIFFLLRTNFILILDFYKFGFIFVLTALL